MYERPGRQMHSFRTQFLVLMSADIVAKLHPIIWSCIWLRVISYKFLQYFESTYFRTLAYNGFYKFKRERFHSIYSGFFQSLYLGCKVSNQVNTNFEKRNVPQAASGNFVQKWLVCKECVLYNICFFISGQNSWKTRLK